MNKLLLFIAFAMMMCSCQEYDLGYSSTEIAYESHFVKAIGKPAPHHQWGFDAAAYCMSDALTRSVYKQDMNVDGTNLRSTIVYGKPYDITEHEHEEVFAWFSNHKVNWSSTCTPTYYQDEITRDCDGIAYVKSEGLLPWGSLATYSADKLGDYPIDVVTPFFNGWIQHVAADEAMDEVAQNGTTTYNGKNMNYLAFRTLGNPNGWEHLNDYNASNGYGYGNQSGQNAILVTDVKFNVVTYGCSADGSKPHDKYYIVYLKGDDYQGWYLGMDLEGYGTNSNEIVPADGVCNDWIIKISDVGNTMFNPARIMCEDLGGVFDTDFNDIVYDVKYENQICTITMQAAGGTMPIEMWYGEKDKAGSFQLKKGDEGEIHALFGALVNQPVNVHAEYGKDNVSPIVWKLAFNNAYSENLDRQFSEEFDFTKIHVYVYNEGRAEWINIDNQDDRIPLRICVPVSTRWCQELKSIKEAYSGFNAWVQNPTETFWDKDKDTSLLY